MSWDLFTSAEAGRRDELPSSNEALARAVAAAQAERGWSAHAAPAAEWTVSAVTASLRQMVEGVFPPLWVAGEVTGFTRARSGHCYFTLRDESSQLRCVMWRDEARRLPTAPTDGMAVRALGRLSLYESRGELQLVVSELEGRGDGLWRLALERLRARLDAEGLTAAERKRPLPRHPRTIGLVTSPSGAVLHDVLTVARRRAPWTRVVLAGCRVQGEGAAAEIADAIRLLGRAGCADVVVVARGGGSMEDLWAFNDEAVARAIAECPVPVISAVGHETDVTIADLVADHRSPTPSAAAEAALPDAAALARDLGGLSLRMDAAVRGRIRRARGGVEAEAERLERVIGQGLAARRERLAAAARHLGALSPLAALNRGFAVPVGREGRVLRRAEHFASGTEFDLLVHDGVVPCRVDDRAPFATREQG